MLDYREEEYWQDHVGKPWNHFKHLERDKYEELLGILLEHEPDHPLTEWFMRGYCMNDGDSCICLSSLSGHKVLNHNYRYFDEEDEEFYQQWFGEEDDDEPEWDF
tara:strand:+ start:324 stop:638 length:315 start_codon:yes stop_codon:yes gene_type:complete